MAQLLHDLGIEWQALIVNVVSFLLLVWFLSKNRKIGFPALREFIEARRQAIIADLDQAEQARQQAQAELDDLRARREAVLAGVEEEADKARQAAQQEAEEVKRSARAASRDSEAAAKAAIERDQAEAAAQLRQEAAQTAAAMCRRLLQQTLDEDRHRALLDEFISDVERAAAADGGGAQGGAV